MQDIRSNIGLLFREKIYKFEKLIGTGSYGYVCKFVATSDANDDVVVKFMTAPSSSEKRMGMGIVCQKCCVRSTLLHGGYVEVMDTMDGDLAHYLENTVVSLNTIAGILFVVRKQLTCIDHSGGAYLDIKCANVLYRKSRNGLLEIHLGDLDSIVKKPTNADDTFSRSFAVPCELGKYGCSRPDDCSAPELVEYLTELLYMSMMRLYHETQDRDFVKMASYNGWLENMDCKPPTEMKQHTELLASMTEHKQVYGYMRALAEQNKDSDTTRCRHCLLVPETGDPTIVDCVRKNNLKGCAVIGLSRHNYVFYGHLDNILTEYGVGTVSFEQMSHPVYLHPNWY